jgi:hypothetical protein
MKIHHIGAPILPPEVVNVMRGDMRSVHDSILHLETELIKQKNPSYPVDVVKVPRGVGFVDTNPTEVFFVRFKDISRVFHMGWLDRSMVRMVSLSMAHDIIVEKTPNIAIMDPFYMEEGSWGHPGPVDSLELYHRILARQ